MGKPSVIIVGAGMAGLTAARALRELGVGSVLLDKGRKPGGRMASRSIGEARFDHGAQHFGVRDPRFRAAVDEWSAAGIVREWYRAEAPDGSPNIRHAAVGGIRTIAEHEARSLTTHTGVTVTQLDVSNGAVTAYEAAAPLATAGAVIITAPLPQTLSLLAAARIPQPPGLAEIRYDPCLAVMARLDGPAGLPDGHLTPDTGPIAWIGDNEHKGVSPVPAVTIHSTAPFAVRHLEEARDDWVAELTAAAGPLLASTIVDATGHRWRYAEPQATLDVGAMTFPSGTVPSGVPVSLAGEVFAGARIEGAFLSGRAAARQLAEML